MRVGPLEIVILILLIAAPLCVLLLVVWAIGRRRDR
jgi:hypothetical protein